MDVKQIHPLKYAMAVLTTAMVLLATLVVPAYAAGKTNVSGKVYEFDKGHYEFSKSEDAANTANDNTYGKFSVQGNFTSGTDKSGIPSFTVTDGSFALFYDYDDKKLNADEDSWHLVDDKSKKVDTLTLDSNIMKGALILQISTDGKNWNTVQSVTDAFNATPKSGKAIYTCSEMQLKNGCYYRFIAAYTLSKRVKEGKVLVVKTDKYETKHYAEVYEFYAHSGSAETGVASSGQTYNLGKKVRVKKFDSFSGEETIDSKDIHYGWDLGNFLVSGFTQKTTDESGNLVFLKNVGDKVTLGFRLKQNINALNGNEKLTITSIKKASDLDFETETTNFGRGALIVQYTDYTNAETKPQIYINYLSATAKQEADTFIQLCEEGDYEVALDYEVTKDELVDKIGRYRIYCKFSVRNSNCMVYPKDAKTGNELVNGSIAENGFSLDLANSRYLTITVKRSVLNPAGNDFVEDTRFNRAAKDGETYTDEGIYTVTVRNDYTHEETTKKIAVGSDPILHAYVTTGKSLSDIKGLVEDGAVIQNDGSITMPTSASVDSSEVAASAEVPAPSAQEGSSIESEQSAPVAENTSAGFPVAAVIGVLVVLAAVVGVVIMKKRKTETSSESNGGANE